MRIWLLALLAIPALVLCSGCASGITMSDEERATCSEQGCTVWTDAELKQLVDRAVREGYVRGWRDSTRQGGRGL